MIAELFEEVDILLVEDNKHDAELVTRSIKKINHPVNLVHVQDGADALDFIFSEGAFKNRPANRFPKLILLDIKMPRVNGIEVLRQLKTNPLTKKIPIIIMTSSKEEQDIIKSYDLGVNSFVVKPVHFAEFEKLVKELGLYWLVINQPHRV